MWPASAPAAAPDRHPRACAGGVAAPEPSSATAANIAVRMVFAPSFRRWLLLEICHFAAADEAKNFAALGQRVVIFLDLDCSVFRGCLGRHGPEHQFSGGVVRPGLVVSAGHFRDHFVILDGLAEPMSIDEYVHHDNHTVARFRLPLSRDALVGPCERRGHHQNGGKQPTSHCHVTSEKSWGGYAGMGTVYRSDRRTGRERRRIASGGAPP